MVRPIREGSFSVCFALILTLTLGVAPAAAQQRTGDQETAAQAVVEFPPDLERSNLSDRALTIDIPSGRKLSPEEFFIQYADRLGLGAHDEMVEMNREVSSLTGAEYIYYQQFYKGVRVADAGFTLQLSDDYAVWGVGRVVSNLRVGVQPKVDQDRALEDAKRAVVRALRLHGQSVDWGEPSSELVLVSLDGSLEPDHHHLAYRFIIQPQDHLFSWFVDVDAVNGVVTKLKTDLVEAWVTATGNTLYNGLNKTFIAERNLPGDEHSLNSPSVLTKSLKNTPDITGNDVDQFTEQAGTPFVTSGSVFKPSDAAGVTAHWATQEALEMFSNQFDVPGLATERIVNFVHTPLNDPNLPVFTGGFSIKNSMAFYGGKVCDTVSVDIVGHEMGHFLLRRINSNFNGSGEGEDGAIRESFADIIGELLEERIDGPSNWFSGGKITCPYFATSFKPRNLKDPNNSPVPKPDYKGSPAWLPTDSTQPDSGNVHHNSTVHSRWFYLLAIGGSPYPYDVTGVGLDAAQKILLDYSKKLLQGDGFAEAQAKSENAVSQICGAYSQMRAETHKAWLAVGVNAVPSVSPLTKPADGETDVDPWPAQLAFQVGVNPLESDWEIELAEDPNFLGTVKVVKPTKTSQLGGVSLAVAEVGLKPDTTYFWRVRWLHPDANHPFECWRPVRSFKTAPESVKIKDPVTGRTESNEHHPWNLEFSWMPHPKASTYTLQVSDSSYFPEPLLHEFNLYENTVELDVLVDDWHYWRVRPNYVDENDGVIAGTWSKAEFKTSMPKVKLLTPSTAEEVYPWPVHFEWGKIKGADRFVFEIELRRPPGPELTEHTKKEIPPDEPFLDLNLRGDEEVIPYDWRVRVIGPEIASLNIQEEGTPAENWFEVQGSWTAPELITSGPQTCVPLHQISGFSWNGVDQATGYQINLFEGLCSINGDCQPGDLVDSTTVSALGTPQQTFSYQPKPLSNNQAIGLYWTVKSIGPTGLHGMEGTIDSPILLQPTIPDLTYPDPGETFEEGEEVKLRWESEMSPLGVFFVEVFQGKNSFCDGSADFKHIFWGFSNGVNELGLVNVQEDSGEYRHSWRVKPLVAGPCKKPQQSQCRTFKHVKQEPPPPALNSDGSLQCNSVVHAGSSTPETHVVELGQTSGTAVLRLNTYQVPDEIRILYEGQQIFYTGCYGTQIIPAGCDNQCCCDGTGECWCDVPYSGASSQMQVTVEPNCSGSGDTQWVFKLECP